jgi:hypothetical protein
MPYWYRIPLLCTEFEHAAEKAVAVQRLDELGAQNMKADKFNQIPRLLYAIPFHICGGIYSGARMRAERIQSHCRCD